MPVISLKAPAKVNLCLEVLGRRSDDYHEVRTILQAVDLADRLTLEPADHLSLEADPASSVSSFTVPPDENLVLRAAHLLQEETGTAAGARLRLLKVVPIAAGLGGGSSDAAATLLGLCQLWGLSLHEDRLMELAARLGSDVPFFLRGGTALASGRGDRLTALPTLPDQWAVVCTPPGAPEEGKTARLYGTLTPAHYTSGARTQELADRLERGQPLATFLYNVFGMVADEVYPGYRVDHTAFLAAGTSEALLAGAGPSLFALAESQATAVSIRGQLLGQGYRAFAAPLLPSWGPEGPR